MSKELEISKKMAILGIILSSGLITENEYQKVTERIMKEYNIISFMKIKESRLN